MFDRGIQWTSGSIPGLDAPAILADKGSCLAILKDARRHSNLDAWLEMARRHRFVRHVVQPLVFLAGSSNCSVCPA